MPDEDSDDGDERDDDERQDKHGYAYPTCV